MLFIIALYKLSLAPPCSLFSSFSLFLSLVFFLLSLFSLFLFTTTITITTTTTALEIEITDGRWQPVTASASVTTTALDFLPHQMEHGLWELIFLLLISEQENPEAMAALFDTGLSPNKGLIAYMRLLKKVVQRAEINDGVPAYLQITEKELIL